MHTEAIKNTQEFFFQQCMSVYLTVFFSSLSLSYGGTQYSLKNSRRYVFAICVGMLLLLAATGRAVLVFFFFFTFSTSLFIALSLLRRGKILGPLTYVGFVLAMHLYDCRGLSFSLYIHETRVCVIVIAATTFRSASITAQFFCLFFFLIFTSSSDVLANFKPHFHSWYIYNSFFVVLSSLYNLLMKRGVVRLIVR